MKRSAMVAALLAAAMGADGPAAAAEGFVPVTDSMLEQPAPDQWLSWRRTPNGWGYSPLDQVDRENVHQLGLVWTMPLNEGPQQGTPLVHEGVMYMPQPGDVITAVDAASGDRIWEYRRRWPTDLRTSFVLHPDIKRNIAIYDNLIIGASGDAFIYALDATTGELVWEREVLDFRTHPTQQSSGPVIAGGRVISGRNCGAEGGPESCVIVAHDARTGEELWRTRTIPAPGEPGDETWGDVPWEQRWHVGTWMPPSYDPELDLIYIGTSVTSPAPKFMLGDNHARYLYHNSTLALDPDSGEIVWYYQHLVDHWDLDHPFERILVDTAVAPDPDEVEWINPAMTPGERRRVLTGIPGKTGVVYTLDRETGEFLWARSTVRQNVIERIDAVTGEVHVNPDTLFTGVDQERFVCPHATGGRNWPAGAYSPHTNAMYVPMQNACMNITSIHETPTLDSAYSISSQPMLAPGTDNLGTLHAVSAETGRTLWRYEQRAGLFSTVTTGGGLLFIGDANGRFRALDQDSGEVLWEVNLGSAVTTFPITFASHGRQYVAVGTGRAVVLNSMRAMTPELRPETASNLYVFALPQRWTDRNAAETAPPRSADP